MPPPYFLIQEIYDNRLAQMKVVGVVVKIIDKVAL